MATVYMETFVQRVKGVVGATCMQVVVVGI